MCLRSPYGRTAWGLSAPVSTGRSLGRRRCVLPSVAGSATLRPQQSAGPGRVEPGAGVPPTTAEGVPEAAWDGRLREFPPPKGQGVSPQQYWRLFLLHPSAPRVGCVSGSSGNPGVRGGVPKVDSPRFPIRLALRLCPLPVPGPFQRRAGFSTPVSGRFPVARVACGTHTASRPTPGWISTV